TFKSETLRYRDFTVRLAPLFRNLGSRIPFKSKFSVGNRLRRRPHYEFGRLRNRTYDRLRGEIKCGRSFRRKHFGHRIFLGAAKLSEALDMVSLIRSQSRQL